MTAPPYLMKLIEDAAMETDKTDSFDVRIARAAYAAGEAAERERAAKIANDFACSLAHEAVGSDNHYRELCRASDEAFNIKRAIEAKPAAPPATTEDDDDTWLEAPLTKEEQAAFQCSGPLVDLSQPEPARPTSPEEHTAKLVESSRALRARMEAKYEVEPEPARPLTLEERVIQAHRAHNVDVIAQLCRDFAREALLCLVLDQVSNTPHKYREEIEYAIAAAEKGEVPR